MGIPRPKQMRSRIILYNIPGSQPSFRNALNILHFVGSWGYAVHIYFLLLLRQGGCQHELPFRLHCNGRFAERMIPEELELLLIFVDSNNTVKSGRIVRAWAYFCSSASSSSSSSSSSPSSPSSPSSYKDDESFSCLLHFPSSWYHRCSPRR